MPLRLSLPRLRIDADVEQVGLAPDGAMDVPKRFDTVGRYRLGARPGEVVQALERYAYDRAPLDRIFGSAEKVNLTLITCAGRFDRRTQNYDQRLVVYATLAG